MKIITLTQGYSTKVDDDDYEKLAIYKWYADATRSDVRAVRSINIEGNIKRVTLSREIMKASIKEVIDHINHDTLDNRKSNLRICTQRENCRNRIRQRNSNSGLKGVTWNKSTRKWMVRIEKDKKSYYLGLYKNKYEGANAYNEKAKELFGEFAYFNP